MPYIIDEIKEDQTSDITVFVILSTLENSFFVWKTESPDLMQVYKKHYYGEKQKTKELFLKSKPKSQLPQMYLLENLHTTPQIAYLHVIAWAKYFIEHGFTSLCDVKINRYAEDLREESKAIYDQIKDIPIANICKPENDLASGYRPKQRQQTTQKNRRVSLILKPREYDLIKQRADAQRLSMSQYCKNIVLSDQNGRRKLDAEIAELLLSYLQGFAKRDEQLKQILLTIYSTKKYYPVDLEILQALIEKIKQQKQEFMDWSLEIVKKLTD